MLAALGVAEDIAAGDVWVATGADGLASSRSRPTMRQVRWT